MKKLFTYIILILSINQSDFCMEIPDSSATWTIASISMGNYNNNITYSIIYDTIINSNLYKAIYKTEDSVFNLVQLDYFCAIREIDNKWYFIPTNDTIEYLLYDFAIGIGDTLVINNPWSFENETNIIALEVDSIELGEKYYKRIGIGFYDGPTGQPIIWEYWIEDIGSTHGLFYTGIFIMDSGHKLLCFHRNDSLIYINSPDNTCGYIKVGINNFLNQSNIKIYPNPVIDYLMLDNISFVTSIQVFDILGHKIEIIETDKISNSIEINVKSYPQLFIIKLIGVDFMNTYRFIKQ